MNQFSNFEQLVRQYLEGNQESIEILKFNTYTLIKQWSKNMMFETDWVADKEGVLKEEHFLSQCFDIIHDQIQDGSRNFQNYQDFKDSVYTIAQEKMNIAFPFFLKFLLQNHDLAWASIHKILYSRCYGWIRKKGISDSEHINILFNESIERFYEKLMGGNQQFNNAANLKSYFFRILELRILEYYRENKRHAHLELDNYETRKIPFEQDVIYNITNKEESKKIQVAVRRLSDIERAIIVGYYYENTNLKDIADELGKSEENIRVLKHRSLKKLMKVLQ